MIEKYPCNSCGICCTELNKSRLYEPMHNGDGICFHFCTETKKCKIYDSRPIICNINAFFERYITDMSYIEYKKLNLENCRKLQQSKRLPIINL